jgi:hypothetical protein
MTPEMARAAAAQGGLASLSGDSASGAGSAVMATTLKADLLADDEHVKIDGVLGEWPARTRAATCVGGTCDSGLSFAVAVRYDATTVYVGGEVTSAGFRRTNKFADDEDHASLLLAFGGGASAAVYEVSFFAGKPGETAGQVRVAGRGRATVRGAHIVEAPMEGGYSFEASLPWSTFAEAKTVRVGLRGAARYYQHDGRGLHVLATGMGDLRHPSDLPPLPTDPEQALDEGLLKDRNLRGEAPTFDLLANVAGDGMKERIQVWGSTLTVCGPGYRGGKDYFFRDLGAPVVRLEARAVTRRAKEDLLVVRRVADGEVKRDWYEVLSFLDSDEPVRTFGQEVAVVRGAQHVDDAVRVGQGEIEVSVQPARGWDASSYREAMATDVAPVLLPWDGVKSQTFRFDGARFTKVSEVPQPGARPAASPEPAPHAAATPASAPVPTPGALLAQYRRDRGLRPDVQPRSELSADLDGDGQPEHVTLIERDLVVTGPSLGGGRAYSSLTLQQFTAPAEIHEVTAKDLVGQGASQLLVRGTRHVAPATGGEAVDMDVLLIYALRSGTLTRVFGAETARSLAGKRVQGVVQFVPARGGQGLDIELRPARVVGWTQATFPWPQEQPGTGAVEPLLLPWGGVDSQRYAWDGSRFAP